MLFVVVSLQLGSMILYLIESNLPFLSTSVFLVSDSIFQLPVLSAALGSASHHILALYFRPPSRSEPVAKLAKQKRVLYVCCM